MAIKPPSLKPDDITLGIDLKRDFNLAMVLTSFLATAVRPFLLGGNGTRAYGTEAFFMFLTLPMLAALLQSPELTIFWQCWIVMVVIRKLLPDRRQRTGYWGRSRPLAWLTFGHNRFFEPILVALAAFLLGPYSVPLGRVLLAGAFSLVFHYRIAAEMEKRRREAIEDAMKPDRYF